MFGQLGSVSKVESNGLITLPGPVAARHDRPRPVSGLQAKNRGRLKTGSRSMADPNG